MRRLAPLERPNEVRGGGGGPPRWRRRRREGGGEWGPGPARGTGGGRAPQLGPPVPHPTPRPPPHPPPPRRPRRPSGRGCEGPRCGAGGGGPEAFGGGGGSSLRGGRWQASKGSVVLFSDQNKGNGGGRPSNGVRGGAAAVGLRLGLRQLYFYLLVEGCCPSRLRLLEGGESSTKEVVVFAGNFVFGFFFCLQRLTFSSLSS